MYFILDYFCVCLSRLQYHTWKWHKNYKVNTLPNAMFTTSSWKMSSCATSMLMISIGTSPFTSSQCQYYYKKEKFEGQGVWEVMKETTTCWSQIKTGTSILISYTDPLFSTTYNGNRQKLYIIHSKHKLRLQKPFLFYSNCCFCAILNVHYMWKGLHFIMDAFLSLWSN